MAKTKTYRLIRPFWDGQRLKPVGTELEFPAGGAPKGSIDVDAEVKTEAQAVAAAEKQAEVAAVNALAEARELVAAADKKPVAKVAGK